MFIIVQRAKGSTRCCAFRCKKNKGKKSKFCPKHAHRKRKEEDPIGYAYQVMRSNAIRRRKGFELTLSEFRHFCEQTGYLALKGRKASSASIDRIRNWESYNINNIQILSLSDNASKGNKEEDLPF